MAISTQAVLLCVIAFAVSAILTGAEIPILKKKQFKQYIREEGPESHQKKSGTPTMGGIAIIIAMVAVGLIGGGFSGKSILMVVMTLLFGAIGFLDDYIKVAQKHNLGLRAWQKLVLQILFAVVLAVYISKGTDEGTLVYIPFVGKYWDFGILYVPFVAFAMVAMANSVNLSDGLDGLCAGVTAIVAAFFAILGTQVGDGAAAGFSAVITGACLGFLVFNRHPAKLFMGDTGSMALGGALASAAIVMRMEFMLVIAGLIYVLEALSVIIQVLYFRKTGGKRFFKMAPIHHHFELCGMKETSVVFMFWGIAAVCCLLAYLIYHI